VPAGGCQDSQGGAQGAQVLSVSKIQKPYRITLHCSASRNGAELPIASIRRHHIENNGWEDVGYHLVIQPDGSVERGRPLNNQGAGVEGANQGNIHICLIGTDKFTRAQFDSLRYQLDGIIQIYNIRPWELWGHNQFPSAIKQGKNCPGLSINRLLSWYLVHREDALEEYLVDGRQV
jgi:N-acetylmuramoyl-L-alanine amidase